jgi:hypothetical protein
MARASDLRDDLVESLEAQVDSLRKEVSGLRKTLSKRGRAAYADASDTAESVYDDLAQRWADAAPHLRKRAKLVEQTARDNPAAAAAVGLVVVGLLAAMLFRK